MGFLDKLASFFGMKQQEVKLLVIGLDNSGKSSILNKMKSNPNDQVLEIAPTVGFTVEQFKVKNVKCVAFDMSGQGRYRNLWESYLADCHGIIFVVDSSDKLRLPVAKDELDSTLEHNDLKRRRVPILILSNKIDLPESMSCVRVSQMLVLHEIKDKPWHILGTNALSGEGIEEGMNWLTDEIKNHMPKK